MALIELPQDAPLSAGEARAIRELQTQRNLAYGEIGSIQTKMLAAQGAVTIDTMMGYVKT